MNSLKVLSAAAALAFALPMILPTSAFAGDIYGDGVATQTCRSSRAGPCAGSHGPGNDFGIFWPGFPVGAGGSFSTYIGEGPAHSAYYANEWGPGYPVVISDPYYYGGAVMVAPRR